jgi:hypothetical protein
MSGAIERANPPRLAAPQDIVLNHSGGVILGNADNKQQPILGCHVEPSVDKLDEAFFLVEP